MSFEISKSRTPQTKSITASGTAAANYLLVNTSSNTDVAFDLTGTWAGTVSFEASIDGVSFQLVPAKKSDGTFVSSVTAVGMVVVDVAAFKSVRARCSAFTSGTIVVASSKATR